MLTKKKKQAFILAVLVAFATIAVYLPALQNSFVTWDDPEYVYENYHIHSLDGKFLKWAFFNFYFANWHPLTWCSHAIDYAIWGLNPLGHHLTSILFHGLNTLLVVLLIVRLLEESMVYTKNNMLHIDKNVLIVGTITGLLFGLHPLHVESVAWVSERKDVLCAFFFLLSILAYIKYVTTAKDNDQSTLISPLSDRRYLSALGLFSLSLLCKPMSVTLPAVLLILDWYPFARLQGSKFRLVLMEKVPFALLSLVSGIITFQAQNSGGAIASVADVPFFPRILVGLKAIIAYLGKMFWPSNLIPFYPYPYNLLLINFTSYEYLIPFLLFCFITAGTFILLYIKRQRIWLIVWAYYLITLLPVLGIIKFGNQAMADRYTYLPSIGPFFIFGIGLLWFLYKLTASRKSNVLKKITWLFVIGCLIASLSYLTSRQIHIWKNGETLWSSELLINPKAAMAYTNRGKYYTETGQYENALKDYTQAISLTPDYPKNYFNRGTCYLKLGLYNDALNDLTTAILLSSRPNYEYYTNRAIVYVKLNLFEEALKDYTQAISLKPDSPETYYNRGNAYAKLGFYREALSDYTQAIKLSPVPNADYYNNRSFVYRKLGFYEYAQQDLAHAYRLRKSP